MNKKMSLKDQIKTGLIYPEEVTCGNACGHFDNFNQCCWLSWANKQEGDYCNYGLVEIEGVIYTRKQKKDLMEGY